MARHLITLEASGQSFPCDAGDTVLRAALRAGIAFPYECNSGGCGSCQFERVSGDLEELWPQAPGLTPRARERGRQLACQTVPRGDCTLRVRLKPDCQPSLRPTRRRATLVSRTRLTADMAEFSFRAGGPADFLPGQYAWLTLGDSPHALQQNPFSMASAPTDPRRVEFIAKQVGDFTESLPEVAPGQPAWDHAQLWGDDRQVERPATSHISIVDAAGNVLSMTTTIESGFGSRLFVRGFLLNNELTDFSFRSHDGGWPIANRVEPGKRPRSSMAPTIVLRDGAPVLAIGSPGGATIIGYTVQAIIAHLDWGLDVQEAVSMPHLVNSFGTYALEAESWAAGMAGELEALGYRTNVTTLNSGLHAIGIGERLQGGADPRREGIALGE